MFLPWQIHKKAICQNKPIFKYKSFKIWTNPINVMARMSMHSEDRQGPFIICNIMRASRGESELLLPPACNMMAIWRTKAVWSLGSYSPQLPRKLKLHEFKVWKVCYTFGGHCIVYSKCTWHRSLWLGICEILPPSCSEHVNYKLHIINCPSTEGVNSKDSFTVIDFD